MCWRQILLVYGISFVGPTSFWFIYIYLLKFIKKKVPHKVAHGTRRIVVHRSIYWCWHCSANWRFIFPRLETLLFTLLMFKMLWRVRTTERIYFCVCRQLYVEVLYYVLVEIFLSLSISLPTSMARGILTFTTVGLTVLIALVLVHPTCCASAMVDRHCTASSCGNIHNISFPFRLKTDPQNCGYP